MKLTFMPKFYLYYGIDEGFDRYMVRVFRILPYVMLVKGEKAMPRLFIINDDNHDEDLIRLGKVPEGKELDYINYYRFIWQSADNVTRRYFAPRDKD